MGAHAFAATNALSGLAATAFTWSTAATTNRSYLNDRRMDQRFLVGASVASGVTCVIDMGGATALVGMAVLNSNAGVQKTDAALRIRAADDAGISSGVVTPKTASTLYSTASPRNKDHVLQFASVSKRYWELTWTWSGSVTNFMVGELFAYASATQLSRRSIYGSGEALEAKVALSEMQYGAQRGTYLGGPVRHLEMNWEDLNATARDEVYAMHTASNFGALPLLFINSYEAVSTAAAVAEQECVYGRLQRPGFRWAEKDYALYTPDGFMLRSEGREAGA